MEIRLVSHEEVAWWKTRQVAIIKDIAELWSTLSSEIRSKYEEKWASMQLLWTESEAEAEIGEYSHYTGQLVVGSLVVMKIEVFGYAERDPDEPWFDTLMHLQRISHTPEYFLAQLQQRDMPPVPKNIAFRFLTLVVKRAVELKLNGPWPFFRIINPFPVMAKQFDALVEKSGTNVLFNEFYESPWFDPEGSPDSNAFEWLKFWKRKGVPTTIQVWDIEEEDGEYQVYVFFLNDAFINYAEQNSAQTCINCRQTNAQLQVPNKNNLVFCQRQCLYEYMSEYSCSAKGCSFKAANSAADLHEHYADKHGMPLANLPIFYSTVKRRRPSKEATRLEQSPDLHKIVVSK